MWHLKFEWFALTVLEERGVIKKRGSLKEYRGYCESWMVGTMQNRL